MSLCVRARRLGVILAAGAGVLGFLTLAPTGAGAPMPFDATAGHDTISWSPDGLRLTYRAFRLEARAVPVRVGSGVLALDHAGRVTASFEVPASARLSADLDTLLEVTSQGSVEVRTLDGSTRRVVSTPIEAAVPVALSSDAATAVVVTRDGRLMLVDTVRGVTVELEAAFQGPSLPEDFDYAAAFSADDSRFEYLTPTSVVSVTRSGSDRREQPRAAGAVSPDGRLELVVEAGQSQRVVETGSGDVVRTFDRGDAVRDFVWTPAGFRALVGDDHPNDRRPLRVIGSDIPDSSLDLDGSSQGQFSPDGRRAIVAGHQDPVATIVEIGADGVRSRELAPFAEFAGTPLPAAVRDRLSSQPPGWFSWSPDGRWVAMSERHGCSSGVRLVDAQTLAVRWLTNDCRIVGTQGNDVIDRSLLEARFGRASGYDRWWRAIVFGLGGNDRIAGAETVIAGRGDDTVVVGHLVDGGDGADSIVGTRRNDTLIGGAGDDRMTAGRGWDLLDGGPGADLLIGGPDLGEGNDRDVLLGGAGADVLHGGGDGDWLRGAGGADTLGGGAGRDAIDGGGGPDRLLARDGAQDCLVAVSGGDRIVGDGLLDRRFGQIPDPERIEGAAVCALGQLARYRSGRGAALD